ncbi:MAG: hypothetical protein IJB88_06795 [Clostridia bacterium]|nr:hypothetical protein [Clostridia bacterium]
MKPSKQRLAAQKDSAKSKHAKNTISKKSMLTMPRAAEKGNIPHSIPNKRSKHGIKTIPKNEKEETTDKTRKAQK